MIDDMREQFEAWIKREITVENGYDDTDGPYGVPLLFISGNGKYHHASIQLRWEGFQAALFSQSASLDCSVSVPDGLHPDTKQLVLDFSAALAEKLYLAEQKYGYSNGWKDSGWLDECRQKLIEHTAKGDPRDVAAYCAFLWYHGSHTTSLSSIVSKKLVSAAPQRQATNSDGELVKDLLETAKDYGLALLTEWYWKKGEVAGNAKEYSDLKCYINNLSKAIAQMKGES